MPPRAPGRRVPKDLCRWADEPLPDSGHGPFTVSRRHGDGYAPPVTPTLDPSHGIADTVGIMSEPKAMSLRFPDPEQRAAIAAAAKAAGVSLQEYILSAAYERATAVEARFLEAFDASMARSGEAFAVETGGVDPGPEQRAAEQQARRDLEQPGQGHAA